MKKQLAVALFSAFALSANVSHAQSSTTERATALVGGLMDTVKNKTAGLLSKASDKLKTSSTEPTVIEQVKAPAVEQSQMATALPVVDRYRVRVQDLSFKSIMRALYAGRMTSAYVNDQELSQMPHIGLTDVIQDVSQVLAIMHPVVRYQNTHGQDRYLVMIERVNLHEDGSLIACHACGAETDLYVFKELPSGGYGLVTRTPEVEEMIAGVWGRSVLDIQEVQENLQPLGQNLMGAMTQAGYCASGACDSSWLALHLPEDENIGYYRVGKAGSDNEGMYGEDSPLYYNYSSTLTIINNGAKYYPIQLHFTGDQPNDDFSHIQSVDYMQIVTFDPNTGQYQ